VSSDELDGQGFLVIGGTEGIGRAIVLLAARRGACVLFSPDPGSQATADDLRAAVRPGNGADRIFFVPFNPASESEVERLFELASDRLPELRACVVNLADQFTLFQSRSLIETSLAEWNQGLSVGLRCPFLIAQQAVQEFLAGGEGGRIVYIIAAPPPEGAPAHVSVETAQSALISFVRSVAKEYGRRRIACNAIMLRLGEETDPAFGQLDAAAEAVLFLASDEASFVNGEVLEVAL